MSSTNTYPARRNQVPCIRIDSPSVSHPMSFSADPALYSMSYPPAHSSSTLFPHEEYEPSMTQFSPLDEMINDFTFEGLGMQLFTDINPPPEFLTGPYETPSIQFDPPQAALQNVDDDSYYPPAFTPSPSSSYASLSPISPQSPWSPTSPSSDYGNTSPMVPLSDLSRRGSSASLRHHHSTSDTTAFGHSLQPPAAARHVRSHSESSVARPVASQAMIEANQKRRRHDAPHVCEDCGQTFTATFSLKRHAQSHTGIRPFTCGIPGCSQSFFNQSDCRRHEKSQKRHKGLPYALPVSP